jgi:hypothetical protein
LTIKLKIAFLHMNDHIATPLPQLLLLIISIELRVINKF